MFLKLYQEIIDEVKREAKIETSYAEKDRQLKEKINEKIKELSIPLAEKIELAKKLFYMLRRFGSLQTYIEDKSINEIMVLGTERLYIERQGEMIEVDHRYYFEGELQQIIQRMVSRLNKQVNEKKPICDLYLPSGERVNIVMPPISRKGPIVTIRKFPEKPFGWKDLQENGTLQSDVIAFLQDAVKKKYNIFVSGGTSSGKTTLLNVLASSIPEKERIITIEDARELRIDQILNQVNLECRQESFSGEGSVTASDLIKSALRMRPDRILVGEVRGEEAIDMLQAMNTGHSGSLSTGHSNSARDMIKRLETMVLSALEIPIPAIRSQIASAIDLLIHVEKIHGKGRRITEICEVQGIRDGEVALNPIFRYHFDKDVLSQVDLKFSLRERWERDEKNMDARQRQKSRYFRVKVKG